MNFQELVKSRRSIRQFQEREIPEETVTRLLEAARWAPSAGNLQPWHFFVIKNKEIKERLASEAYGSHWLSTAAVIILICALPEQSAVRYGKRGESLYCLQDTAAATQNLLLAAKDEGLGACWVGAFDEKAYAEILALPQNMRPVVIIPLGYPAEEDVPPERRPLEEIVSFI